MTIGCANRKHVRYVLGFETMHGLESEQENLKEMGVVDEQLMS